MTPVSEGRNSSSGRCAAAAAACAIADRAGASRFGSGTGAGSAEERAGEGEAVAAVAAVEEPAGAPRTIAASTEPSTPAPHAVIADQYGSSWNPAAPSSGPATRYATVSSAGPASPASPAASVDTRRPRATKPTASPASRASVGMVRNAVCDVTADGIRLPLSTPRRTSVRPWPGRSDGPIETSATIHISTLRVATFQRAAGLAAAAHPAKMPAAAPSPAAIPITRTGCTPVTCASRAGCMVSGRTASEPSPAARPTPSAPPAPSGRSRQRGSRPVATVAPRAAAVIVIQATQASCAVH